MEVLAAVGFAGNIIQFVDFSGKLVSKTAEICKSGAGALIENVDIETATNDLILLSTKLHDSAGSAGDTALRKLCQSCGDVAQQLLGALNKVKANGKHQKWKSFRKALQSVWKKEDIAALEQRLVRYRDELNFRVILDLRSVRKIVVEGSANVMRDRERLIQFSGEHSGRLEGLDVTTKNLVDAILDQRDIFKVAHDEQLALLRTQHDNNRTILQNQYLEELPIAAQAGLNSYERRYDSDCLPNTRIDLLQEIREWADGTDKRPIFWLRGLAGTGKSAIARTIAREYYERRRLAASFFFSKDIGGDVRHAGKFFTTLAAQLAEMSEALKGYICDVLAQCSHITTQVPQEQWRQLILGPLSKLKSDLSQLSLVLVVDALDECDNEDDIRAIVQLLSEARSLRKVRLRIFITSRPDISIRQGFDEILDTDHEDFILHDVSRSIVDDDIRVFVEYHFAIIAQQRKFAADWPGRETIRAIVQRAAGLFIWAVTACRYIKDGGRFTKKRLYAILNGNISTTAPERCLDKIYLTVLKGSIRPDFDEEEQKEHCSILREVLGAVVILFSSLSATSLARLLDIPKGDIDESLKDLHAILDLRKEEWDPIRLHHPSFRDFLLNRERCDDLNFWVDERKAHQLLAHGCIALMSAELKRDVCNLQEPGVLAKDISDTQRESCLPPDLQYACRYWVQHLKKSKARLEDNSKVHKYLRQNLLHWFEALSLIGETSEGVHAIILLESMVSVSYTLREFED